MSVRITAAGAVAVALLFFTTASVSACDDRFIKKCESDSAAAWAAEQPPEPAVKRKPAARVRTPAPMAYKPKPAVPAQEAPELASADARPVQLDTPAARRFRGFIDPVSMTVNSFEGLRKPRPDAAQLVPAPTMPPADMSGVAAEQATETPQLVTAHASAQDSAPVAAPVVMKAEGAPLPALAQAPAGVVDLTGVPAGPVVSTAPGEDRPSGGFRLHHLMLALCGALGAAGALRFIVGT